MNVVYLPDVTLSDNPKHLEGGLVGGWNGGWQGVHRLDKIFVHDFSMTISLLDFAFVAFCRNARKCRLSTLMLYLLAVAKTYTILVQFRGDISQIPILITKFHDFRPIFHNHFYFSGFPVSVVTLGGYFPSFFQ